MILHSSTLLISNWQNIDIIQYRWNSPNEDMNVNDYNPISSFSVETLGTPILILPKNAEVIIHHIVQLNWTAVENATQYSIQIDNNPYLNDP